MQATGKLIKKTSPRVNEGETLSNLIQMAIDDDSAIVVEDAGKDIGVITRADILRTVIEGTEMS
jgi:glycine betaine/proline transport system ATP-binding protein